MALTTTNYLTLYRGNFAVVLSATNKEDKTKRYAIKVIDMEKFVKVNDQVNLDRVQREIEYVSILTRQNRFQS